MPDIFSYDVVRALSLPGCPLCRALDLDDERWMTSFWREGRQDPGARKRFFEAGGFCPEHAWLLHRVGAEAGSGAAIADVYGRLATHDLRRLERVRANLGRPKRVAQALRRSGRCPACVFRAEAVERKAHFLAEALAEERIRAAYGRCEGLCFTHLAAAVEGAASAGNEEGAVFLLDDWSERLAELRSGLAEYDRKRDYRCASEPKGPEQRSWTDVIHRYVGEDPTPASCRRSGAS